MFLTSLKTLRDHDMERSRADRHDVGNQNPIGGTVVVLGATSGIGRAVVRAAAETGRPVIAIASDRQQLESLGAGPPGAPLKLLATTIATDADGAGLAESLRVDGRRIAAVVDAIAGHSGRGRLIDHPPEALRQAFDEDLLPHLAAARHLIPLLGEAKRGGSYLIIGGPGSEAPWANYGLRSVAASALRMMTCVLYDEARPLDVRVQMLSVATPVRSDVACRHECSEWPTAAAIGRHALRLVALRDGGAPTGADPALVAAAARAVVRHVGGVESSAVPTTTQGRSHADVRSFLNALNLQDRNEVSADDTP